MICDVHDSAGLDTQIAILEEKRFFIPFENLNVAPDIDRTLQVIVAERTFDEAIDFDPAVVDLNFNRSGFKNRKAFRYDFRWNDFKSLGRSNYRWACWL